MNRTRIGLMVVLGVAALAVAVPAGAVAGKGKAKGHTSHNVAYVFKGHIHLVEDEESIEVEVERGNSRVRKGEFIGKTVSFSILESTRIVARDTNGDHKRSLADVQEGDWVLVTARLPRKEPGSEPFDARKLIDKTSFRR